MYSAVGSDPDPFHWDVATVANVLAAPDSPWTRDPATLAAQIYEEDIDGETLLKFEHICSRQELMQCLGIRLARHKVALGEAILALKSKSWAYRRWKHEFEKSQADLSLDDGPNRSLSLSLKPTKDSSTFQPNENESDTPSQQKAGVHSIPKENDGFNLISQSFPSAQVSNQIDAIKNETKLNHLDESDRVMLLKSRNSPRETESVQITRHDPEPARPMKRKRIAPLTVAERPLNMAPAFISTEADKIAFSTALDQMEAQELPWEKALASAYLGDGSLPVESIKASTGSLSSRLHETSQDSFVITAPNRMPAGRRLVVHRVMKQLLKKNSRVEMLMKQGFIATSLRDSESILDLDDLPDAFDDQTLKEMEDERLDREQHEANVAQLSLSSENVRTVLDDAIQEMSSIWKQKKLPKHQRTAYHLWHDALRTGTKKMRILEAHTQAKYVDERIKKLCTEIMDQTWIKPSELRNQANCLKQSIQDKLYNKWLAEMLESRISPPKPDVVFQPKNQATKKTEVFLGEEDLTSSDEDDFIVPDDDPKLSNHDAMELDEVPTPGQETPTQSVKTEFPEVIDLTRPFWGPTTPGGTVHIDLTTPITSQLSPLNLAQNDDDIMESRSGPNIKIPLPSPEELGSFQEIGSETPKHWAKKDDKWKLLVCLIWQLPHSRQAAMIEFLQVKSMDDAWDDSAISYFNDPIENIQELGKQTAKTISFDITRIFLSFVKTKDYQEDLPVLLPLDEVLKENLLSSKMPWFSAFQSFIRSTAAEFPQASHIYNSDSSDDDFDEYNTDYEDLLLEEEEGSQLIPKKSAKEIIQNKEAVDLRELEKLRVRDQQARRDKLRDELSQLESMPRDRARLIVNESKHDDQPFIYVNEDIGKRIKDHQLEGVRFMWNQIVLDSKSRQGCLLAHTMGLGKTMQVITLLVVMKEAAISPDPNVRAQIPEDLRNSRTAVVCPTSLVNNWIDELLMWVPDGILGEFRKIDATMRGVQRPEAVQQWAQGGGVLVIGYHILGEMLSKYPEMESLLLNTANIVIADEAHTMKNPSTNANKSCSRFKTESRIALTGSPLANNVQEYHTMIEWVAPNFLGPLAEFREIYAKPIEHGLWRDSTSPQKRTALKKLEALKVMVAPKVNRATIKSCLKEDLPPKWEFVIFVPPTRTQSRIYNLYIDAVSNNTNKIGKAQIFAVTDHLRLICNHPRCFEALIKSDKKTAHFPKSIIPQALKVLKTPDPGLPSLSWKVELLNIILDEAKEVGDKVLVFSQSLTTIEFLLNLFKMQMRTVSHLTGATEVHKRQEQIKTFNKDKQEVYLISTTAGGVGLNIHGANRVVIFDFKWNPVQEQQAIGRAYRIGQKKTVFVYRFVVAGSFEEDLHNRHVFKTQLASRVVDSRNPLSWSHRRARIVHNLRETKAKSLKEFEGQDHILDKLIQHKIDGQSIRSIISTDTFEEEDLDVVLTDVERRDVDNMVELNRLRIKDPTAFSRAQERAKQEEYHRLVQIGRQVNPPLLSQPPQQKRIRLSSNPSTPQLSTKQSLPGALDPPDRTSDGYALNSPPPSGTASQPVPKTPGLSSLASYPRHLFHSPDSGFGPAPLPVAGANTYFGNHSSVSQSTATAPTVIPTPTSAQAPKTILTRSPTLTPIPTMQRAAFTGGNLFSQPRKQSKFDFQTRLESRINDLRQRGSFDAANGSTKVGRTLTDEIDAVRKNMGHGFLPDNQRWKDLESFLTYDQFVIALVSGHWTPTWVAMADKNEIEGRIKATTGLPGQVISAQAGRRVSSPDPNNLRNIERSGVREGTTSRGLHAREDMEVMREAAENRRRRGKHPAQPATPAPLVDERRTFPAKETMN